MSRIGTIDENGGVLPDEDDEDVPATCYERALAELRQCEQRLKELRAFIAVYEEMAGRKPMQDWEQMAEAAIRHKGRPLRAPEIYKAIVPMGFHIDSQRPADALATRLSRSPYFERISRGLFANVRHAQDTERAWRECRATAREAMEPPRTR